MVEMARVMRVPISGIVVRTVGVSKVTWCVVFSEVGAVSEIEILIGRIVIPMVSGSDPHYDVPSAGVASSERNYACSKH
jgi:hypothetical protein